MADSKYKSEQGDPTIGMCSVSSQHIKNPKLDLRFDGKTLTLSGGKACYTYPAFSGNDKGAEKIPEGKYWINPAEIVTNSWRHPLMRMNLSGWGTHRVTLHPFAETEKVVGNRGGFFIHGGDQPGSLGCIDLVGNMERFVKDLRGELSDTSECFIGVTVKYFN